MVQVDNAAIERRGRSFSHKKKEILRIDMTPMVDLGFLLITFFVFTTTMSKPTATDLFLPKDPIDDRDSTKLINDLALTLLLYDSDKILYYHGDFNDAMKTNEIFESSYSTYDGIGEVIREKQKNIDISGKFADGRKGMMLLIKPTSKASYKNVIDALDEVMIHDVRKYAIVEPSTGELEFIKNKKVSGF